MCYQLLEVYAACRCLYYKHAVDRCGAFGRPGHTVVPRTISVGYTCAQHNSGLSSDNNPWSHYNESGYFPPGDVSDTASDASSTLSASTTLTIPDATGDDLVGKLFRDLVQDPELTHLLPQLVRQFRHLYVAKKHLGRLLKRYSHDLAARATGRLHRQAWILVRSSRMDIAQRIVECHLHELQGPEGRVTVGLTTETRDRLAFHQEADGYDNSDDENDQPSEKKGEEDLLLFYDDLALFLFGGAPFEAFKGAVTDFVNKAPSEEQPKTSLLDDAMYTLDFLRWPVRHSRKQRAWWTCACGRKVYDDYEELRPGAVEDLQVFLASNSSPSASGLAATTTAPPTAAAATTTSGTSATGTGTVYPLRNLWSRREKALPRQRQDMDISECSKSNALPGNPNLHRFLMVCIPFMKWGLKLRQPDVCRLHSDRDLFKLLRRSYAQHRKGMRWSWIRTISRLDFVQFEMYHDDLVSIQCSPSLPSLDSRHEYDYEMPDTDPPIGPNLAMHLLENPDHAHVLPILLNRIPIRRNRKLSPCPIKGVSVGWGLQFIETVSPKAVFASASAGFVVCLIVAVSWTVVRQDVQGSFGIGALILAFSIFCSSKLYLLIPYT